VLTVTTSNIIKNRGAKNPNRQKSGFIQASPLPNEEIRRASEQTSPQVAAAAQFAIFISNTILGVGEDQGTVVLSFTGEHTQKVDSKGRMSIPADFRRVLEAGDPAWNPGQSPRMYLLYGDHLRNQLQGYTVAEFDAVIKEIADDLHDWLAEQDDDYDPMSMLDE